MHQILKQQIAAKDRKELKEKNLLYKETALA